MIPQILQIKKAPKHGAFFKNRLWSIIRGRMLQYNK